MCANATPVSVRSRRLADVGDRSRRRRSWAGSGPLGTRFLPRVKRPLQMRLWASQLGRVLPFDGRSGKGGTPSLEETFRRSHKRLLTAVRLCDGGHNQGFKSLIGGEPHPSGTVLSAENLWAILKRPAAPAGRRFAAGHLSRSDRRRGLRLSHPWGAGQLGPRARRPRDPDWDFRRLLLNTSAAFSSKKGFSERHRQGPSAFPNHALALRIEA